MPVEIREIVIKTEIKGESKLLDNNQLDILRLQIMNDCKKMIHKEIRVKHSR